jgi:two-component system cell cycle sensor histidine kinase PleC
MKQFPTSVDKNIVDMSKKTSASTSAVRDFRSRLNSIGDSKIAYEEELLKSFAHNQVNAFYVMPALILTVAIVSSYWINWHVAALWSLIAILSHAILVILSNKYLKTEEDTQSLPKWRAIFFATHAIIGLVWAIYTTLDCSNCGDNQYAIIQFSAILVFQAVSCLMTYAFRNAALLMITPVSLILAGSFITTYEPAMVLMGCITVCAIGFFYMIADRFKKSVITMLEYTTTKEILIAELETEKSISEAARNRAEEANLAKSRFLATMSHELRTPLNAILGFSEIMRDELMGPVENENYKEYVGDIHNSGSHLLKLINEILDISRIEAGKHELQEEKVKLISVVDDACHMINIKAKQKNVKLTTLFEENMPTIWVDERAIRQITLNLVSNALKFTPSGGHITVKVGWTAKGGQYISIKDTGPGIPEDEIPIVLSSFGQGTIAINNAEQGTGLGLTIVQALLQMHQGSFDLKSKLREGTEAIAYLPVERVTRQTEPNDTGKDNKKADASKAQNKAA